MPGHHDAVHLVAPLAEPLPGQLPAAGIAAGVAGGRTAVQYLHLVAFAGMGLSHSGQSFSVDSCLRCANETSLPIGATRRK